MSEKGKKIDDHELHLLRARAKLPGITGFYALQAAESSVTTLIAATMYVVMCFLLLISPLYGVCWLIHHFKLFG